ncbi:MULTISPECIES: NAD(P)/FAD-dependent oxidoreductase [Streptomyces]|uniref:NAD(P)/FAD-dependent oxidoreductase n=2 Tax=Streptomyces TaxID=1883 RepID=A0ABW7R943_9ACTN|nr:MULTISPECIES: FAD-binding oxidoreductase [Streptomyces]MYU55882.1 FAD-dependent oxidoreductase [Streptomyces sp. SID7805]WSK11108.1 FAD-binding oxidoreductase [Streptomyces celluloflavus]
MAPTADSVPLPEQADVVIIGGGVIGASIAFHLAEADAGQVLLLERDEPASGSSGKPIGGVRAQFSDPLNIRLGLRSLDAWRGFARRPGADIGLDRVGYLFLLADESELATFTQGVEIQNALGVPSRIISPRAARDLCPYVDPHTIVAAAYSPADGYALPGAAVAGYLRAARRLGATVRTHCPVTAIDTADGTVQAVRTPYGTVRTHTVVCCAGAWSGAVGALAGVELPVTPLRRQIAFTGPLRPAPPRIPFTLDFGSTLYFHNDGADGLLMGLSDPAQQPGFERRFTREWLRPFRTAAARRTPELARVPVTGGWAGLYEMTPDRNALIGEAGHPDRFLYATGFSGHGFLQAPAVGELVRDLCLGREPFLDVGPLAATRFDGRVNRPEAHII